MEELCRRCAATAPEAVVVVTPHSVHVEGHFAVVTAGKVGEWETDSALAAALLEAPLPILGVSYGGNDTASAEFPLDWGAEVPLDVHPGAARGGRCTGPRPAARGSPPAGRGDRRASRPRRPDRERRPRPRARPRRPVRLRSRRSRLRRPSAGDPRVGPARLPAARRHRRAGEGRLALAARSSSRARWERRRAPTSSRTPRRRTTGCSWRKFRRRRRAAIRQGFP